MRNRTSLIPPQSDWRLDFCLADELPEDSIIGRKFIGNAIAGLFATAAVLTLAWSCYSWWSARAGITDWEGRILGANTELTEIEQLQANYMLETAKVDEIHDLMNNPIPLTILLGELGRTLPEIISVDMIESNDDEIVVRGTLEASSEQASKLIGNFVKDLATNEVIGPHFEDIKLSGLERFDDEDGLSFEFTMIPVGGEDA